MSTEEFQRIVLEELKSLKNGQDEMKQEQQEMKQDQQEMKKDLKAVIEQTANLTEFKQEQQEMLDKINTLEIIVSQNWNDIAKLKAAR
ncbi:hypothetical protein [Tissierella creatinophila]|uniref:Uncharacterized protein n=1 Tax=Tissierella creatinophila DSM 6911 TaxID=1123403 RepID=A0A1U7M2S4_TISCR|nr:hypothetical protein [Tissierella creatinophila]OLS01519.1 hypothetical protein TICRE_25580 [Tissierella creatinophila DSM 6911]